MGEQSRGQALHLDRSKRFFFFLGGGGLLVFSFYYIVVHVFVLLVFKLCFKLRFSMVCFLGSSLTFF